jgi:polyketide synthase 13
MSRSSVGPVLLAGYSFGGIVAFAVADGLTRAGYSVRFLGLLDSEAHLPARSGAVFPRHVTPRRKWRKLGNIMAALRNGTAAEVLAGIVARRLSSPRWKTVLVLVARTHRVLLPRNFDRHLSHELQMNLFRPMVRQWSVMSDLLPPLDAIAVLFRTDDHAAGASPDLGWRRLCPRLTIVPVPGTHLGMLRAPNLAQVCAAFARAIPEQIGEAPLRPTAAGA